MPNIANCPWCHYRPELREDGDLRHVTCNICGAGGPFIPNEAQAIDEWNLVANLVERAWDVKTVFDEAPAKLDLHPE